MKRIATIAVLLVCAAAIISAAVDLRCAAIRPSGASLVLACSASRLEARP